MGIHPGWGTAAVRVVMGVILAEFLVAAAWVKFRLVGWDPGRLDVMLVAGGLLLFVGGPGQAAVDGVWLAQHA